MKIRNFLLITLLMSLGLVFAGCDDDDDPNPCGNGVLDVGEECDGNDSVTIECSDLNADNAGVIGCNDDCTFDDSDCHETVCGDGRIEGTETCDGTNLGDATCEGQGDYSGGTLTCTDLCTLDTTECVHTCNVDGMYEDCNVMGTEWECCPINGMPGFCWGPGEMCMQSCGEPNDCGWNSTCQTGITGGPLCYANFCGPGVAQGYPGNATPLNEECEVAPGRPGSCNPIWSATDEMGICIESGTIEHDSACHRDDENEPTDGVTGVDPDTQCLDGVCATNTGETDGFCISNCDPLAALDGTDPCPANWNCLNYSDMDYDYYVQDANGNDTTELNGRYWFREPDYGHCYPMNDTATNSVLTDAIITCNVIDNTVLKDGSSCPSGESCKVYGRGSLMGICSTTDATGTALVLGDECNFQGTYDLCGEGLNCFFADPLRDATELGGLKCGVACDASATDADAQCAHLTTDDATPMPYTCLSVSRFMNGGDLPVDNSETANPVYETKPSPLGFCVPPAL